METSLLESSGLWVDVLQGLQDARLGLKKGFSVQRVRKWLKLKKHRKTNCKRTVFPRKRHLTGGGQVWGST